MSCESEQRNFWLVIFQTNHPQLREPAKTEGLALAYVLKAPGGEQDLHNFPSLTLGRQQTNKYLGS